VVGGKCFGRWFEVGLHLGGDIGWLLLVVLRGLSSGLTHGGHQMLGLNSRRLLSPEHEGGYLNTKVWNAHEKHQ
jgi:hypothetical protein